jgi:hypothetical protein
MNRTETVGRRWKYKEEDSQRGRGQGTHWRPLRSPHRRDAVLSVSQPSRSRCDWKRPPQPWWEVVFSAWLPEQGRVETLNRPLRNSVVSPSLSLVRIYSVDWSVSWGKTSRPSYAEIILIFYHLEIVRTVHGEFGRSADLST